MKKLFTLLSIVSLACSTVFAQGPDEGIMNQRKAFLEQRLNLTPEEGKNFWPLYDRYNGEMKLLRLERAKQATEARMNKETMSDKDLEAAMNNQLNLKQKEVDIEKKYNEAFKKVLPIDKVAKLYMAQEEFKRNLVKRLKD